MLTDQLRCASSKVNELFFSLLSLSLGLRFPGLDGKGVDE